MKSTTFTFTEFEIHEMLCESYSFRAHVLKNLKQVEKPSLYDIAQQCVINNPGEKIKAIKEFRCHELTKNHPDLRHDDIYYSETGEIPSLSFAKKMIEKFL